MPEDSRYFSPFPVPEYHVAKVAAPPPLAAGPGDAVWDSVPPVMLVDISTGDPMDQPTEVRALWTDQEFLVQYRCTDRLMFNPLRERDAKLFAYEVVEMFIGPGADTLHHYREFQMNAFNVQWDGEVDNPQDSSEGMSSSADWSARSFRSDVSVQRASWQKGDECLAWIAGMAIGFQDLSQSAQTPKPGDVWRANFMRIERRPWKQYGAWSPMMAPQITFHVPSRFGRLIFQGLR